MTDSQNDRMTEGQGKSSIASTFSKRGYNKENTVAELTGMLEDPIKPTL